MKIVEEKCIGQIVIWIKYIGLFGVRGVGMNCEICNRKNAEHVGIMCGKHQVCFFCIERLVNVEIEKVVAWEMKE